MDECERTESVVRLRRADSDSGRFGSRPIFGAGAGIHGRIACALDMCDEITNATLGQYRRFRAIGKYREHHIEENNGTGLNDAMAKWKAKAEKIDG